MNIFELVLAGLHDGVMVLDAEDKVIYANPALSVIFSTSQQLLGLEDSVIGKRPLEIIRLVEISELIEEVRQTGEDAEKEMKLVYPFEKILLGSANLVRSDEFGVGKAGVVVLIKDITEMKKLENLRREFVANVSHELKTPLTAIRSYAETLLGGAIDDPQNNRKFLEKINRNTESLSALINDILEISRLEARRGVNPFIEVDLEEEVEKALETLAAKIKGKKIEISRKASCKVNGDADQLYRAVLNLLDNAINYSSPGGKIEINCTIMEGETFFSITDYGIGISKEHQPRIFERFYRADKARSRELGGTGLGLSIVKHIMDIHGGRVLLESEEGKGAVFTLIFPGLKGGN